MMPLLQVSTTSLCTYANFPDPTEPFKSDHICLPHCFSPTTSPYNLNLPLLYPHFFNFFLLYYFITGSYHCVKSNVRAEDFLHSAENSCLMGGKKGHSTLNTEKAMTPHSSTLAWKIPWTEEPGRLQSMGSLGVGHDWGTSLSLFAFMHWRRKWQPTPVFLPGESQRRGSLVGCHLWGHTESDTTEAT